MPCTLMTLSHPDDVHGSNCTFQIELGNHRIDNLQGHLTDMSLSGGIIGTLSLVMSSQDDVCQAVFALL